jgi:aspartate racemase
MELAAGGWPVLGVLGGMGPVATADFLLRLARATPAGQDQDHLPTIVYSDPQTPDRSDSILGIGPSPLPAMARGIDFLNRAGCAVIAIPCNTAHYWYDDLAARSATPILHIADATAAELAGTAGAADAAGQNVGIMATDGTVRAGIYQRRLAAAGVRPIELTDLGPANPVMRGIRAMKAGRPVEATDLLREAGAELVRRGATALVLACTDVSAALAGTDPVAGTPTVDAADCLARASLATLGRTGLPGAAMLSTRSP